MWTGCQAVFKASMALHVTSRCAATRWESIVLCLFSGLQERLALSAVTHPTLHPYNTKQQANPHGS